MPKFPLTKFHFKVNIPRDNSGGKSELYFTEVSGLESEIDVIEYRYGDYKDFSKVQIPGLQKFSRVVLKRGYFKEDNELFEWFRETQFVERVNLEDFGKTITINLLDVKGVALFTWTLSNAWPSKLTATDLKADASEIAIETLELAHSGMRIEAHA